MRFPNSKLFLILGLFLGLAVIIWSSCHEAEHFEPDPIDVPSENPIKLAFVTPVEGEIISKLSTVKGIASSPYEIKEVYLKIDNGDWLLCNGNVTWQIEDFLDPSQLNEGEHTLYAKAIDKYVPANEKVVTLQFVVNNGLGLEIITPYSGQMFSWDSESNTVNVEGTVTGLYTPIDVRFKFDEEPWTDYVQTADSNADGTLDYLHTYTLDASIAPEMGNHIVWVEAKDAHGNVAYQSVKIDVIAVAVGINIITPQNNSRVSGVVTLRGSYTANPAPAEGEFIKVYIDGQKISTTANSYNGIWSINWDTGSYENGYHVVTASVEATSGGQDTIIGWTSATLYLSDVMVSITEPANLSSFDKNTELVTFKGTINTSYEGSKRVELWFDDTFLDYAVVNGNQWELADVSLSGKEIGTHVIEARAFDSKNNMAVTQQLFVLTCVGSITGFLQDAQTGNGIVDATIVVRDYNPGPNFYQIVGTITSTNNTSGTNFIAENLSIGKYALQYNAQDFVTIEEIFELTRCETIVMGCTMMSKDNFSPNEFRFVLCWDKFPTDLDLHATFPDPTHYGNGANGRGHVYWPPNYQGFPNQEPYVELDKDDTTSYGPETISVKQGCFLTITSGGQGPIKISVLDFNNATLTNSTEMVNKSQAVIRVYKEGVGYVPPVIRINDGSHFTTPGSKEAVLWKVLTVDPYNYTIDILNTYGNPTNQNGNERDISDRMENFDWF